MTDRTERSLALTADALRRYSRAGNFHSDATTAAELGLPARIAQGMHVAGPAIGALLDAWGAELLERGEVDLKFTAMVAEGHTADATVARDGARATITVTDREAGRVAVVGTARVLP